jgi:hypothetical protein
MVSLMTVLTKITWISLTARFLSSMSSWYCRIFYFSSALMSSPSEP